MFSRRSTENGKQPYLWFYPFFGNYDVVVGRLQTDQLRTPSCTETTMRVQCTTTKITRKVIRISWVFCKPQEINEEESPHHFKGHNGKTQIRHCLIPPDFSDVVSCSCVFAPLLEVPRNTLSVTYMHVRGSSQVDGRPPVLTAISQSNGNGRTLTTHRIQTP